MQGDSATFRNGADLRIGLLGGGQLGRMTIQAALDLDYRIHILDPDPQCPCARIAHQFTQGDLNDAEAVIAWGRTLNVVTVEIENVSIEGLTALKAMGVQVLPDPSHLALIRDKGTQKEFYASHGIPTSDFALVEDGRAEVLSRGLPVVQKLRTGGYDGRGVQVIRKEADAADAFDAPCVLEDAVAIDKELSVIVARSTTGEVKTYPVVESVFNELNLVDYLVAPARISETVADEARRVALSVVEAMDFVGLLAIELFLDKEGRILINEVAPRPHNSGHHTIEACGTSQFEQHLRAILGLPLGDTSQWTAAAMLNLIGAPDASGAPVYPSFSTALAEPGLHPHIYGKAAVRPGRKMGHVTLLAETADAAEQRVKDLRDHISTVHAH